MLTNEELASRINDFITQYGNKADLPVFIRMAMQQFVPMLPALLSKPDNQIELLELMDRLCWVIGYKADFYPGEDIRRLIAD